MKRAIRKYSKDVMAIIGLIVISAVVGGYILTQQRLRFPLIDEAPFELSAELDDAHGITPGQGQTVEVSGVKIGRLADTRVKNGKAIVKLELFPRYDDLVKTDAKALLRPRTGLKDMFLDIDPGSPGAPVAKRGFTIPIERTLTDVDLDEVLETLDQDTREYVQLLVNGTSEGLDGRGDDLAELFRRFGPTVRDLRRVDEAVAKEREAVKDSINGLALLSEELAGKDEDLSELVDSSAAVFRAFASEDRNVAGTIARLPGALRQTTETMREVETFAAELRPAADALVPTFRALDRSNRAVIPNARAITPVLRDRIRPFVRETQPLLTNLSPAAAGLADAFPDIEAVGGKLNNFLDMLAFNPNGREDPGKADRQEGYLFWLAWVTHQSVNLFNIDDANGPLRPIFLTGTCSTLVSLIEGEPALEGLSGLSALLADQCDNPQTASIQPEKIKRRIAARAERREEARK